MVTVDGSGGLDGFFTFIAASFTPGWRATRVAARRARLPCEKVFVHSQLND